MHRGEEGVCVIYERDIASTDIKLGKQLVVVGNPWSIFTSVVHCQCLSIDEFYSMKKKYLIFYEKFVIATSCVLILFIFVGFNIIMIVNLLVM